MADTYSPPPPPEGNSPGFSRPSGQADPHPPAAAPDAHQGGNGHPPRPNGAAASVPSPGGAPANGNGSPAAAANGQSRLSTVAKSLQGRGSLSDIFIKRPVMTVLLTVASIVLGLIAYRQLAVNDLPAVDYPVIQVSVSYPGASPTTMANNVATPLEKQFLQIPGVDLITSSSTQSNTSLVLQFTLNKNIDAAATDVQAAIQRATGNLPVDLPSPPTFTKTNPNDQPVYYVGMASDTMTDGDLYKYANDEIAQRLSILSGVSQVNVYGVKGAVRIKADPAALAARGLTMDDLANAIRAGTVYSGAGQFDGAHTTYVLQPNGQINEAEGYRNLIVARAPGGAPVYLRDVAQVIQSVQDERMSRNFWVRGFSTPGSVVVLAVSRQAGANAVEVAAAVKQLLPQMQASLPGSVRLFTVYDRSQTIVNSVDDVQATLLIAFGLVVAVIYVFLGRATDTLIPVVALPLSLLLTFVAMYALGYSINNLTLMALTLAIGFLVDDAIVFLENVVRRAENGETILQATFHSAREISFTILSMTLSLAAVFLPLVLMPGLMGRIFREFSVTIIVAILASGVVSLTLTPMMCARIISERRRDPGGAAHRQTFVERVVGRFFARVIAFYGRTLNWFLDYSWLSVPVLLACFAGVFFLVKSLPFTLLPTGDSGFIQGIFLAKEGASPEEMHAFQTEVDKVIHANPNVAQSFTLAGFSSRFASNQALVLAFLKPVGQREPIDKVIGELTGQIFRIPGIFAFLRANPVLQISLGATNQNQGRYAYTLSGINPEEVYGASEKLVAKMNQFPGFVKPVRSDYFHDTPNLNIDIDRERAATYGVTTSSAQGLLRTAYSQNYIYLIKETDDQYQVILEAGDVDRTHPEDLRDLYVHSTNANNALVPLRAVTRWNTLLGAQSVNHLNQFPSVTVNYNLAPGFPEGDANKFIENASREILAGSPSVQGTFQGEALVLGQLIGAMPVLFLAALFAMYIILGILYESYIHPITVLSTLVPAIVGGLLTLWVFHASLSLYSFIGLFLLMGIVKKNGIMIVDFAIQRLEEGYDRRAAIHEASVERFRPIMMTTLAALMGAVPLAAGFGADASSRQPLGFVIVGGLLVSQLITLYVTPVVYLWLETFQEKVLDRVPFLRSTHSSHQPDAVDQGETDEHSEPAGARREPVAAAAHPAGTGTGTKAG